MRDENPNQAKTSKKSIAGEMIGIAGLTIALLALVCETMAFQSRRLSWEALRSNRGEAQNLMTLGLTARALALDPFNHEALYTRAYMFKETNQLDRFGELLPVMLTIHPNQANVRRLAGEYFFNRSEPVQAADFLWEAMWINPSPPISPVEYWRMTMAASEQAGRSEEALLAMIRALSMMNNDRYTLPEQRKAMLRQNKDMLHDMAEVFAHQGKTPLAEHMSAASHALTAPE